MSLGARRGVSPPLSSLGKADFVFEISWEVCNKVGGIYTVVSSKAARMKECYGAAYWLVGPYKANRAAEDFREKTAPPWLASLTREFAMRGIYVRCGTWNIKGKPQVLLIDFERCWPQLNEVKKKLWDWYGVDSLSASPDYDEPVLWAWAVGVFLEGVTRERAGERGIFHCHEWLSGAALLYLKRRAARAGLVFTTHATVLGRALANRGVDIYAEQPSFDPRKASYDCGVAAKYGLERAVTEAADVFTTVSAMTGDEAQRFLGRAPDFLLPNGLDIVQFPSIEEEVELHEKEKIRLLDFLGFYFFPYYAFDPHETLFYFIASRYEWHDKGIDVFIEALGMLNRKLAARRGPPRTIVVFFWIPGAERGLRPELQELRSRYILLRDHLRRAGFNLWERENAREIFGASNERLLKRLHFDTLRELRQFKREGNPPFSTHTLANPDDQLIRACKAAGLENSAGNRVKVVWYPIYLSPHDGLLGLGYLKSMRAAHLGVFPSYYEPWGYTPLEAAALGIAAVTTDLSGFGRYLGGRGRRGVYVVKRAGKTNREVAEALARILFRFSELTHAGRHEAGRAARRLAELADWKHFVRLYIEAHNRALLQAEARGNNIAS